IIMLVPSIEIRDPYRGNAQATGTAVDAIRCYGEASTAGLSPWRFVVISFLYVVPGLGRRKVVILDQRNNYAASILLKDTFTDTAGTLLDGGSAHVMDVGNGWTINPTSNLKVNPSGTLDLVTGTAPSMCWADSGQASFSAAQVDILANANLSNRTGLWLRVTDQSNG